MRRTPKRTSFLGMRSRTYRCRLERLESRSMMAADVAESSGEPVPDGMAATESTDPIAGDEWQAWDPAVCELQKYDFVDPMPVVDPVIIDDSGLIVDDSSRMVFDPVDIRVQFVSSETEPGWAAYSYTVGADGVVQGVSVVASYDEPTIAAFVTEHRDDPTVEIFDYGDAWWIGSFPLELAPPVPEYGVFYGGDETSAELSFAAETADVTESVDVGSDWSWDDSSAVYACGYAWDENIDAGADWTWETSGEDFSSWSGSWDDGSWGDSGSVYANDWSWYDRTGGWYDAGGYGGDGAVMPLFYARGAELSEPVAQDAFDMSSLPNDADVAATPAEERDVAVAVPASLNPRSAAFADMSMMAAAAAAAPGHVAEAVAFGGGRRRR